MRFAGLGFRSVATARDLVAIVERAAAAHGLEPADLDGVAIVATKIGPVPAEAAERLSLRLAVVSEHACRAAAPRALTRSSRLAALTGGASLAEISALAAAGADARLLGPRVSTKAATCAIAEVPA